MALKRFTTDRRLWFWISLVLFVIPWFLPLGDMKGSSFPMGIYVVGLFFGFDHFGECLVVVAMCSLFFSIPAAVIGWVIQCIVVMIREARRRSLHDAA
jgi:hypothetical protein